MCRRACNRTLFKDHKLPTTDNLRTVPCTVNSAQVDCVKTESNKTE